MIEPIRISFEVSCGVAHAFQTWTAETSRWWPADHTVTAHPDLSIWFEPRVGGRIYERTRSGEEHDWGEITIWEPPYRVAYLWHLRADRADATEVEITFRPTAVGGTIVQIEHRGWELLGSLGAERRDANRAGWTSLLPHFVAACGDNSATR